ncbi:MAG: hypothetical protein ACPGWR_32945 [Ardenticatenaceae bacterium]
MTNKRYFCASVLCSALRAADGLFGGYRLKAGQIDGFYTLDI